MIKEHLDKISSGEVEIGEYAEKVYSEALEAQSKYNYFTELNPNFVSEMKASKGELKGLVLSIKDGIWVKGMQARAGSKILEGFKPFNDATLVRKLKEKGAVIIGKNTQDEFGYGSFGVNTKEEWIAKNPYDKKRACGGSSSGCAGYVSYSSNPVASIGESTGGSIACPSSFTSVVGLTPTYGLVSRYGVIDLANSMDKPGPIAKSVSDAFLVLDIIKGEDNRDFTSLYKEEEKEVKFAYVKELFSKDVLSKDVYDLFSKSLKKIESKYEITEVSLKKNIEYGVSVYGILGMSETSTNLAKYSGIRYGIEGDLDKKSNEYFSSIRKEFCLESKRRLMLGTFARMSGYRDAYYLRAAKARLVLLKEYQKAFETSSVLLNPSMPYFAPKFSEISEMSALEHYKADLCLVPANISGLPHLSIPMSKGLSSGILLTSNHYNEKTLFNAGKIVEGLL